MFKEGDEFFTKSVRREVPLPGGETETIEMPQWYWTTMDWLVDESDMTEEMIVQFGLKHPQGEDLAENVKTSIYVLFHSYDKQFNPDEYDGTGYDEYDPDQFLLKEAMDLLGIEKPFSEKDLKKQYMTRIAKIHPDLMDQYNEAFELLKEFDERKINGIAF